METNEITDDETEYFKFEPEFAEYLEFSTIPYAASDDVIRANVSFNPPVTESEHIVEKDEIGKVVTTQGGVLLGKMSFHMTSDEFDVSGFSLVEDMDSYPITGIKINIDAKSSYQHSKVFKFTDKTSSKDADLNNLIVSSGTTNEDDPDKSTYKEYTLTPEFDKDTLNYEITLLEYVDKINIKATPNDTKSTMKIKAPKRDDDGNTEYDTDGTTIIYEQNDLINDKLTELTINKLGEADTKITIIVTAEDNKTSKEYTLTIKRPYGTIKGSIVTSPTTTTTGKYKAQIRIYKSEDVADVIDWSTLVEGQTDDVHDKLLTLNSHDVETNDDGTYEIYVVPGKYDVLIDKTGYLDQIYKERQVNESDIVDLGNKDLIPGDVNKDGVIQLLDYAMILNLFGIDNTSVDYDLKYDFNEDGQIQLLDYALVLNNFSTARIIE